MCSWCWGYAPVLERLVASHDIGFRLILGGLRPGPAAQALTEATKAFILHHWDSVAAASGQRFDRQAFAARPADWMYDTELPAVAVVAMRRLQPDSELPFFLDIQEAFYARGVDVTDRSVYLDLAARYLDPQVFVEPSPRPSRTAAWEDFAEARRLGATGFPTTLLHIGGRWRMLAAGYQPYEYVDPILHAALDRAGVSHRWTPHARSRGISNSTSPGHRSRLPVILPKKDEEIVRPGDAVHWGKAIPWR